MFSGPRMWEAVSPPAAPEAHLPAVQQPQRACGQPLHLLRGAQAVQPQGAGEVRAGSAGKVGQRRAVGGLPGGPEVPVQHLVERAVPAHRHHQVRAPLDGRGGQLGGVDVAVDAAGSGLATAIDITRKGGKVAVFGVNTQATATFPQSQLTFKELQVLGAWLANATFPAAVKVLESRVLDLDGLISHKIPLTEIHKGLDLLANRQALKIVVHP